MESGKCYPYMRLKPSCYHWNLRSLIITFLKKSSVFLINIKFQDSIISLKLKKVEQTI